MASVGELGGPFPLVHICNDGATHLAARNPLFGTGAEPEKRTAKGIYLPELRFGSRTKHLLTISGQPTPDRLELLSSSGHRSHRRSNQWQLPRLNLLACSRTALTCSRDKFRSLTLCRV